MTQSVKKRGRARVRVFGQSFDAQGNLVGVPIECRFAFPYLFEKRTKSAAGEVLDTPRNDIVVLVPKTAQGGDCQNWQKLSSLLMEAAVDMWGSWPAGLNPKIQDGDVPHRPKPRPGVTPLTEEQIQAKNEWRKGHWVIEAACPPMALPKVAILADGKPVEIPAQVIAGVEQFKSGDYGYIALNAYTFENKGNWGVNFGMEQVMFSRAGERIGGGSGPKSAEQMFGGIVPAHSAAPAMPQPQYAAPPTAPAAPMPPQPTATAAPAPQYAPPVAPVAPTYAAPPSPPAAPPMPPVGGAPALPPFPPR